MMNITTEEKGSNPPPSSCHATAAPLVLFFESSAGQPEEISIPFKGCEGWPEFAFTTSYDDENLVADVDVDLLNCFSSTENNNNNNASSGGGVGGGEVIEMAADQDDLFSAYIDMKKLEDMKETNNINNLLHASSGGMINVHREEDNDHQNGGGFVVETNNGGGVRLCGGRRKKKERMNKNVMIKTGPTLKKRQRRSPQSCLTTAAAAAENGFVEPRKAMAAEELAELWSIDPKRAKRIVANRHSAARSKERKAQYIVDLEENVKKLNSEVAFLNTRLIANQKETTELAAEKIELKRQLQNMESQAEQVDAQIQAMEEDIKWLRSATGEMEPYQTDQQPQPQYFQFHQPMSSSSSTHQQNKCLPPPLLQNCQQSMLPPYLNVANSQPLF
ncbi:OLC1v1006445C1 [Oldenlandia corymbosa var. corymbosa]|uniref:OLC1v1006445C1 n=1 Tax=Oldenlandia corymbosa var. corymbosa TaxID=529605 RepID=A0AAV1DHB9_OLDCO|nr:OLC1v1006445C1 [Oldenlandia corymbosa var. corymbosa]